MQTYIGYLKHCHFKRLKLLIDYINRLQKAEQEDTHKRSPSSILVKVIPFTHKTNILWAIFNVVKVQFIFLYLDDQNSLFLVNTIPFLNGPFSH